MLLGDRHLRSHRTLAMVRCTAIFVLLLIAVRATRTVNVAQDSRLEYGDSDEFDDTTYETASSFGIHRPHANDQRLHKRNPTATKASDSILFYFDSSDQRFVLKLGEQPNVLSNLTVVNIHQEAKGAVASQSIAGKVYQGDRLVVLQKSFAESKYANDLAAIISLDSQPGIKVSDEVFGRFYIDSTASQMIINGAFVHEGQFLRVNNAAHPISKPAAKHMHSVSEKFQRSLIVSSQDLAQASQFPTHRSSARKYRCGHDDLKFNHDAGGAASFLAKAIYGPEDGKKLFDRAEKGCPSSPKVIYMGIVADCSYLEAFKGSASQAQANIINDFNLVSSIYEKAFNINLGILSIDLMMECAAANSKAKWNVPCKAKVQMDEKLNLFTLWRGSQTKNAGLYHLVSGCTDSDIVGIAWLNQVCQTNPYQDSNGDTVAGTSVSVLIKNQFAVIAHEIGHNFGAVHDCDAQTCLACKGSNCECCPCSGCDCKGQYVMNPESGGLNLREFSGCSQKDICQKIPILATCLKEPGLFKTISGATCGDGIRDHDEECDCGGPEKCKGNPCCTENCKLKQGAVCSDNNDTCCKDCQLIPASTRHVCQPSKGLCQKESVCDGKSRDCPPLNTAPDGTSCEFEGGQCASGQCTSRSQQCSAVGARLGLTESCPYETGSCSIVCKSGTGCVMLDAVFIDGTPCGYSGKCYSGTCSEPAYKTFVMRNVAIIGIIFGALLFFVLLLIVRKIGGLCRRN